MLFRSGQWKAVCKKKYKELRQPAQRAMVQAVGQQMKDWIESEEGRTMREKLRAIHGPCAEVPEVMPDAGVIDG